MKHLVSQPHIILSTENSPYPDKVQVDMPHEGAIEFLQSKGPGKVISLKGHYGSPEDSILISNPNEDQRLAARVLAHEAGQESHIESDGFTHRLVYHHGPKAGKVDIGTGTQFHSVKPKDNYSVLPDGTIFSHNFNTNKNKPKPNLTKGQSGDWKKEGYEIKPEADRFDAGLGRNGKKLSVNGLYHNGKKVGEHIFHSTWNGKTGSYTHHTSNIEIHPQHRRKGLATAMYQYAEQSGPGDKMVRSKNQTAAGRALWLQPNRPFGKSLQKASTPTTSKVNINPEHGKAIANAYENMKHDPNHPDVKAAYNALIGETKNQYKDMLNQGFKISKIQPNQANPYKTSKDLHADIKNNKHMWFFPTEQGYGSEDNSPSNHPMLQPTEFMHEGKPLLANDLFRIVHDYRGHHLGGESTFGPKGEHQAYLTHKKDFSPLAQKALASETMGQNSWVNFGPHGEHNRKNPHQTIYAEQKAGLLPEEIINGRWHE